MNMFYVYILQLEMTSNYYVGQTNNLKDRLDRHNNGMVKSTKGARPWKMIYTFNCATRSEAMLLEKRIKGRGARRYLF